MVQNIICNLIRLPFFNCNNTSVNKFSSYPNYFNSYSSFYSEIQFSICHFIKNGFYDILDYIMTEK
jgi:hypothetical protein